MTLNQLADVLDAHGWQLGPRDLRLHCRCGWASPSIGVERKREHLYHQAAAILAADSVIGTNAQERS